MALDLFLLAGYFGFDDFLGDGGGLRIQVQVRGLAQFDVWLYVVAGLARRDARDLSLQVLNLLEETVKLVAAASLLLGSLRRLCGRFRREPILIRN